MENLDNKGQIMKRLRLPASEAPTPVLGTLKIYLLNERMHTYIHTVYTPNSHRETRKLILGNEEEAR